MYKDVDHDWDYLKRMEKDSDFREIVADYAKKGDAIALGLMFRYSSTNNPGWAQYWLEKSFNCKQNDPSEFYERYHKTFWGWSDK